MKLVGPIRLIVCKHIKESGYGGKDYTILGIEHFVNGFMCKNKYSGETVPRTWVHDEIREGDGDEVISNLLKDESLGFYEIIGDFCIECWQSGWETVEYESRWDLSNTHIREISYKQAEQFDDFDVIEEATIDLLYHPKEDGSDAEVRWYSDTIANPYMPVKQILRAAATALDKVFDEWEYRQSPLYGMDEKQLRDYIDMQMVMISDKHHNDPKKLQKSLEIEEYLQHILRDRTILFEE